MKGWISIHRSIKDHWLYPKGRPFTKYEAWITILLEVNHTDVKELKGFNLIECKRGESIKSLDTWAKIFNWTKSKVRRFFILLEKDSMIVTTNVKKTTHLRVLNYDSYQDNRNKTETKLKHKRNDTETNLTPNNNGNNLNNDNNEKETVFLYFWDSFHSITGIKKTDKDPTLKYWSKLTDIEQQKAKDNIKFYFDSLSDKKYCKKARTYLSDKNFNDEFKKEDNKVFTLNNYDIPTDHHFGIDKKELIELCKSGHYKLKAS